MGKQPAIPPSEFKEHRIEVGLFFCDICGFPYPIDQKRPQVGTDGLSSSQFVGLNCCYEPNGSSIDRDLLVAFAASEAARYTEKELRPPEHDGDMYAGTPRIPSNPSFVVSIDPNPVVLIVGSTTPRTVVLTGNGFTASDVISYGAEGILDADAPSLDSSTQRTLSIYCSPDFGPGPVPIPDTEQGIYSFTFNGTVWPSLFDVRSTTV